MKLPDHSGTQICRGVVKPEWIDINGHMNVAYYVLAFDLAVDALWARIGIDDEYIETTGGSTFAVETHISYKRELKVAEPYVVTAELIAYDQKRVHQFQRMFHAEKGFLAATAEWMNLHVDLRSRKVSAWPDSVLRNFAEVVAAQQGASTPLGVGKQMHIADPLYRMGQT